MSKKKIGWIGLIIGLLVVAFPVLVGGLVPLVNCWWVAGDNDTWISFWASYAGSIATGIISAIIAYIVTKSENNRIAEVTREENDRNTEIAKKQAREELRLRESNEAMQSIAKKVDLIYRDTNLINRNAVTILSELVRATDEIDFKSPVDVYKALYSQTNMLVFNAEVDWNYDTVKANADLRYTYMNDIIWELDFVKNYLVLKVLDNENLKSDLEKLIECYEKLSCLVKLVFKIVNIHEVIYKNLEASERDKKIQENLCSIKSSIDNLKALDDFFNCDDRNKNLIEKYTNEIRKEYEHLYIQ